MYGCSIAKKPWNGLLNGGPRTVGDTKWKACFFLLMVLGPCLARPKSEGPLHSSDTRNKLLYIMIDGFRHNYVKNQPTDKLPGFNKLLDNGVQAEYMTPIFPSLSYPDWTTLVTGRYPESHGIVGNYFYDAEEKDYFSLFDASSTTKKKWWTSEPIWTTAKKANLTTGVILWSRCDVLFDEVSLDHCEPFVKIKGHEIFRQNAEKAINKLKEGYDFVQLYNEHTDNVGHEFGPDSEEVKQAVRELDTTIVYVLDEIEKLNMTDKVNIIVVSDHGMADTTPGKVERVEIDDFLDSNLVESIADAGAFSSIKVKEGNLDKVYDRLKKMTGVNVYKHDEIPEDLHIKNSKYIHDIILTADITSFIMKSSSPAQIPAKNDFVYKGAHGFNPKEEQMRTIFFAKGPDFKSNKTIDAIENVDVYPLLAHLLGVEAKPHNGSFDKIKLALNSGYYKTPSIYMCLAASFFALFFSKM